MLKTYRKIVSKRPIRIPAFLIRIASSFKLLIISYNVLRYVNTGWRFLLCLLKSKKHVQRECEPVRSKEEIEIVCRHEMNKRLRAVLHGSIQGFLLAKIVSLIERLL